MESHNVSQPAAQPTTMFKKRPARGKSNFRKRAVSRNARSTDSSSTSSSEDEVGEQSKRRKINSSTIAASNKSNNSLPKSDLTTTKYEAKRSTTIQSSNDATKQSNWYDENAIDTLSSRNLLGTTRIIPEAPDGTYKGMANASTFIRKNPDSMSKSIGPIKAPTNIRTITVTDFAPDVCKDYKQTGFCGFGDNCKFVHSREDYKQGWQLDKEWETVTKDQKVLGGTKIASANRNIVDENDLEEEDAKLEQIPFACIICKESYKDPIITKCGHYFCESCALKRYKKDPSCAACGAGTGGVFNVAKGLKKLLERKRSRAARQRERAIEAGEDVSDIEEDS